MILPRMTQSMRPTSEPVQNSNAVWTQDELSKNPHHIRDKAHRVQTMFAAIAHRYDLNNRLHSLGRDQAWRRRAVSLSKLKLSDDVLDVACGTGDLTEAFAAAEPRSVTGLDFTREMLAIAQHKSRRVRHVARSKRPIPTYVHGDASDL